LGQSVFRVPADINPPIVYRVNTPPGLQRLYNALSLGPNNRGAVQFHLLLRDLLGVCFIGGLNGQGEDERDGEGLVHENLQFSLFEILDTLCFLVLII